MASRALISRDELHAGRVDVFDLDSGEALPPFIPEAGRARTSWRRWV